MGASLRRAQRSVTPIRDMEWDTASTSGTRTAFLWSYAPKELMSAAQRLMASGQVTEADVAASSAGTSVRSTHPSGSRVAVIGMTARGSRMNERPATFTGSRDSPLGPPSAGNTAGEAGTASSAALAARTCRPIAADGHGRAGPERADQHDPCRFGRPQRRAPASLRRRQRPTRRASVAMRQCRHHPPSGAGEAVEGGPGLGEANVANVKGVRRNQGSSSRPRSTAKARLAVTRWLAGSHAPRRPRPSSTARAATLGTTQEHGIRPGPRRPDHPECPDGLDRLDTLPRPRWGSSPRPPSWSPRAEARQGIPGEWSRRTTAPRRPARPIRSATPSRSTCPCFSMAPSTPIASFTGGAVPDCVGMDAEMW